MRTQPPAPATQHEQDNPGHRVIAVEIDGADYGCITCGKTWQIVGPPEKLPPLMCPACVRDPQYGLSKDFWLAAQLPGITYRCGFCGRDWQCTPEQKDSSTAAGQINWSQPQPDGTYRCEEGWNDTSGTEFGCMKRADTTCSNGELRCTQHALIFEITGIREAMVAMQEKYATAADDTDHFQAELLDSLKDISAALWDTNYTHMSLTRRAWYRARGMWSRRIQRCTSNGAMPESASDELGTDHAW
jgi:hypothetical protein